MKKCYVPVFLLLIMASVSCTVSKHYSPTRKFSRAQLQQDYSLLRNILEAKHPSLYWYTSRDSMDFYFSKYYNAIADSMTEQQFTWHVIAPLVDKIHCGHTSVSMSKAYYSWASNRRFPSFPLYLKVWNDTMAVTANLDRKDSIFKRGTLITAINGISNSAMIQNMFGYLPEDGYANNINYIRLSANFPYFHRNIYGLNRKYTVTHIDSSGHAQTDTVPVYVAPKDSSRKDSIAKIERRKLPRFKKILQYRSLEIDSSGKFATMTLNTFSNGRLRSFFRRSFKKLKKENINNLILDVRSNGGGNVSLSTLLSRYISKRPFKIADSTFSRTKSLAPYTKYIKGKSFNNFELFFIAHKKKDGLFHITNMERRTRKPKSVNHYDGNVYVLTNGPTFSAAALFCNSVKGQPGILLVGEETGGGWYGNNGIMIPDIKLPNTKIRVRLPLFRIVQYNHIDKKGTGIIPDIYVPTSYDALLKGYDKKIEVIKSMIFGKTTTP